jgi:hypothetical protein
MKPNQIQCPSCGATHDIYNPGIITLVCDYCGNAVYWDEDKIRDKGKQSVLPEGFSRLYRGATGSLFNKRFHVLGRVRYSFGKGFWDEWFLEFNDGETGWLSEDNHEFAWEILAPDVIVPPMSSVKIGDMVDVKERLFVIEEIGEAECIGMEGSLPKDLQTGETYPYADGSSPDGRYTVGIEYDEDPPTVFVGRWLKYASLSVDDEELEW